MNKSIAIFLLVLFGCEKVSFSQSGGFVLDTLCVQGNPSNISTDTIPGNTYQWLVQGGNIIQGANSPSVTIQWNQVGLHEVSVVSTNSNGCNTDTLLANVYVTEPNESSIAGPYEVCLGSRVTLQGSGGTDFEWSNQKSTPNISFEVTKDTVVYLVTYNGSCPNDTAFHYITALETPIADFNVSKDTAYVKETVTFTSSHSYFLTTHHVAWYIDGVLIENRNEVTHSFYAEGEKEIELVISTEGCGDTIKKRVFVLDEFELYIPNAFSPNGDGVNDDFVFSGKGVKSFNAVVTDRWGMEVFSWKDDFMTGWDGTVNGFRAEAGVYTYSIVAYDFYGRAHKFYGHLNVIH